MFWYGRRTRTPFLSPSRFTFDPPHTHWPLTALGLLSLHTKYTSHPTTLCTQKNRSFNGWWWIRRYIQGLFPIWSNIKVDRKPPLNILLHRDVLHPTYIKDNWVGSPEFCWCTFSPPHKPATPLLPSQGRRATRPSPSPPSPPPPRTQSPPPGEGRPGPLSLTLPCHHSQEITLSMHNIIWERSCS